MQICGRERSGLRAGRGGTRLLRRHACRQRALHLVAGGGVDVQPQRVEQLRSVGGVRPEEGDCALRRAFRIAAFGLLFIA
jgi:hypothetical protein